MNKTLTLLSLLVFAAFLGGIVYSHADQSISQSASTTEAQSVSMAKASDRAHVFSDLRHAAVKDSQGQYVGRINDLVINPDGRISFAVLSPFGMDVTAGMNERLVAVPFDALSFNGKYLVLDTTSEKLVNAPLFRMSYLTARNWAEDANRYFGIQPSWEEGVFCGKPSVGAQKSITKGWNRSYGASEIVGTRVEDAQGEVVGKIDDLLFNDEGRISFAILGYGGFLGIDQNLVAVPITSLSSSIEEPGHFVLNTTKENLQSAPLFSKKAMDDPGWANGIYRYFGQQPYWTKEN